MNQPVIDYLGSLGLLQTVNAEPAAEAVYAATRDIFLSADAGGDEPRPVICVLGAPGSGKSTHCGRLAKEFGCVHLSAGQALKAAAKGSGPDSDKIREWCRRLRDIRLLLSAAAYTAQCKNGHHP